MQCGLPGKRRLELDDSTTVDMKHDVTFHGAAKTKQYFVYIFVTTNLKGWILLLIIKLDDGLLGKQTFHFIIFLCLNAKTCTWLYVDMNIYRLMPLDISLLCNTNCSQLVML